MEIPDGTGEQLRAGDHTSIEITHPSSSLVSSIKIKMEDLSSSVSIARVPEKLTKENRRAAYSPERLSIGPFHHGTATLKEMESQKWRYSFALLSRSEILKHYNHFTRKIAECKISTGPSNTRLEGFLFLPRFGRTFFTLDFLITNQELFFRSHQVSFSHESHTGFGVM